MNKIPLVNSHVYEFFIDPNIVDEAFKYFLSLPITTKGAGRPQTGAKSLHGATSENEYIPFYHEKLFIEIQKCVDLVCDLHFKNTKMAICDSWLTKTEFGKQSTIHTHNCSIFSGLVYFSDSTTPTKFILDDPFLQKNAHLFESIIINQNYTQSVEPKLGKIIIWDSSLKHKISVHKEKDVRYTLAFNTWLTGSISNRLTGRLHSNVIDVKQKNQ